MNALFGPGSLDAAARAAQRLQCKLQDGWLAALHSQKAHCSATSGCAARLQQLIAEAPNVGVLCLHADEPVGACELPLLLQPLEHAAHLQTLYLDMMPGALTSCMDLVVVTACCLSAPAAQASSGTKAGCPTLQ